MFAVWNPVARINAGCTFIPNSRYVDTLHFFRLSFLVYVALVILLGLGTKTTC